MAHSDSSPRTARSRRRSRRRSLLVLAGLPLLALHVFLLLERVTQRGSLDTTVILRWILSVALLLVLHRGMARAEALRSTNLGIAAVLIFVLIHAPVMAPEPTVPLAASGAGLGFCLAVVGRRFAALSAPRAMMFMVRPAAAAWSLLVSPEVLKDRAPPCAA